MPISKLWVIPSTIRFVSLKMFCSAIISNFGKNQGQHRTIPALRLKHRSGSCGTASALPKCSIMSGCGTRIVLWGQKPLALCDRCPCFSSLFPPLAALTFAASSIICAFGLASAAPRSPYRHLELCGITLSERFFRILSNNIKTSRNGVPPAVGGSHSGIFCFLLGAFLFHFGDMLSFQSNRSI